MKNQEKRLRPSLAKNLAESGTDHNDSFERTSPVLKCLDLIICDYRKLRVKIRRYDDYSLEDQKVKIADDIFEFELYDTYARTVQKAFLVKLLEYKMGILNREIQLKQTKNKMGAAEFVLPDKMPKKIIVDCTINELGTLLGNFTSDALNANGDHVFKNNGLTLSEWASVTFVMIDGDFINPVSIYNCLGKGDKPAKKGNKPPLP